MWCDSRHQGFIPSLASSCFTYPLFGPLFFLTSSYAQSWPSREQVPQLGFFPSHRNFLFLQTTQAIRFGRGTHPAFPSFCASTLSPMPDAVPSISPLPPVELSALSDCGDRFWGARLDRSPKNPVEDVPPVAMAEEDDEEEGRLRTLLSARHARHSTVALRVRYWRRQDVSVRNEEAT